LFRQNKIVTTANPDKDLVVSMSYSAVVSRHFSWLHHWKTNVFRTV